MSEEKVMQSLLLDYSKAIETTQTMATAIEELNKQLSVVQSAAKKTSNGVNDVLGSKTGTKNLKDMVTEQKKVTSEVKQSEVAALRASAAVVEQRVHTKGLSKDHNEVTSEIRKTADALENELLTTGKLKEESKEILEIKKEELKLKQQQVKEEGADAITGGGILESELQRRLGWFFTGSITFGTVNAIKEAVSTFKEVEMGVTEIARVMNDSSFVFKEYRDNLLALGVEYGQTFDVVQNIALRWAQSGYSTADSLELARTSLLALNTAELDARNATESMIGIMAQWQLEAGEMELVMDKINKTADNYTVTSQDLVDGLLRSSGAARVMNVSLDETIGLLTVMREASGRTGREVGKQIVAA